MRARSELSRSSMRRRRAVIAAAILAVAVGTTIVAASGGEAKLLGGHLLVRSAATSTPTASSSPVLAPAPGTAPSAPAQTVAWNWRRYPGMGRTRVSGPVTHPAADHAGAGLERLGQHSGAVTMGPAAANVTPAVTSEPKGLDVSSYQQNISWSTVRADGARFAYVKATEGTGYVSPSFATQYNGSFNVGLIRGAYHFALPDRSSGAAQADFFVSNGGGWSADGKTLPGALDIEYNPYGPECYGKTRSGMVSWIRNFVSEYQARTSRWPVIYSTTNWWSTCTGNSAAFGTTVPLWIACYCTSAGTLPAGWPTYTIWQYADSGTFPGDQDLFHGTFLGLERLAAGARSEPVALVGSAGTVRVYARETNRAAYQDALPPGGNWTGLQRLGGTWPANLAALVSSSGPVHVFAVGSGGHLYDDVLYGATWSGWKTIASATATLQGRPAVVQDHQGTIRVYVRGMNRRLYETRLPPGGSWTGLSDMGGVFPYDPAAFVGAGGYVWVFEVGANRVLYVRDLPPGGSWSAWGTLTGGATGVPAVVQDQTHTMRVYVRGADWALHALTRSVSGWSNASSLGGRFPGSPAALVADGYVWAFEVGTGGVLYERHLVPGGSWSAWAGVTSGVSGVPAAVQDHSGTIRIYLRGGNSGLYQVRRPLGQSWSAMLSLGGPLF